jgi:hypothetical protein
MMGLTPRFDLDLPRGFKVLSVKMQRQSLCFWISMDATVRIEPFQYRIIEDGESYHADEWNHIATVQEGESVWHIFQKI